MKAPGQRHAKLDQNEYTGIFLGYTATNQNIRYLDTTTGIVKTSHHATFDKAWYLQPTRPPAAQLLYDLGLEAECLVQPNTIHLPQPPVPAAPWPPMIPLTKPDNIWSTGHKPQTYPLPLRATPTPDSTATAARITTTLPQPLKIPTNKQTAADLVTQYLIGRTNMATIYMSPKPYHQAFEEELNLRKFDPT